MANYLKFELDDGTFVYIETTDTPKGSSGLIPAGKGAEHADATLSFDKSIGAVGKMAVAMLDQFRKGFADQPEEVAINFSLKASGELGNLIVSRGGSEANYGISIRWRKEDKHEDGDAEAEKKDKK
jgi:hypothetical protein